MDYQNLINNYQTEFTEEYKDISARKLYRNILKDLKYMFLATRNMNLQSKIKYLTLEQDLFYKKDNLEKGEYSHYILLSTGKRKPRGYGRLIELNQRKQTEMEEFYEIFYLFKIVINIYYKYYKPKTNEYLVLFAAILEMITFVFGYQLLRYNQLEEYVKSELEQDEIPTIEDISVAMELRSFLNEKIFIEEVRDLRRKKRNI